MSSTNTLPFHSSPQPLSSTNLATFISAWSTLASFYSQALNHGIVETEMEPGLEIYTQAVQTLFAAHAHTLFLDWYFDTLQTLLQRSLSASLYPVITQYQSLLQTQQTEAAQHTLLHNVSNAIQHIDHHLTQLHSITLTLHSFHTTTPNNSATDTQSLTTEQALSARFYSVFHAQLRYNDQQAKSLHSTLLDLFRLHLNHMQLRQQQQQQQQQQQTEQRPDIDAQQHQLITLCQHLHHMQLMTVSSASSSSLLDALFADLLFPHIDTFIRTFAAQRFDIPIVNTVIHYVQSILCTFIQTILTASSTSSAADSSSSLLSQSQTRLLHHTYRCFTLLRIDELFDIIVDYPTSLAAILDLTETLQIIPIYHHLIHTLIRTFHTRLLHPGASTSDILTTYINTIRVMKYLSRDDGLLLPQTTQELIMYVRHRTDCVRCVMKMIIGKEARAGADSSSSNGAGTDNGADHESHDAREDEAEEEKEREGNVDLRAELELEPEKDYGDDSDAEDTQINRQSPSRQTSTTEEMTAHRRTTVQRSHNHPFSAYPPSAADPHAAISTDPLEQWQPDSLDAHPTNTARKGRHADVLTLLFSLTPLIGSDGGTAHHAPSSSPSFSSSLSSALPHTSSYKPFLDEYRSLLSTRLLHQSGYNRDTELIRHERLKVRLGEEALNECEVMVKDIENSRRTITRVTAEIQKHALHVQDIQQIQQQYEQKQKEKMQDTVIHTTQPVLTPPLQTWMAAKHMAITQLLPNLSVYLISAEYWPAQYKAALSSAANSCILPLPQRVLHELYAHYYHVLASPRVVLWLRDYSVMEVDIVLSDRTVRITCDSVAFAVLAVFSDNDEDLTSSSSCKSSSSSSNSTSPKRLSVADIVSALGLFHEEDLVRNKLSFWQARNIVRPCAQPGHQHSTAATTATTATMPPLYEVMEELSSEDLFDQTNGVEQMDDSMTQADEQTGRLSQLSSQAQQNSSVSLDTYIFSVLNTFSALTVPKLHFYLSKFGNTEEFVYRLKESELQDIVNRMEEAGVLQQKDGVYRKTSA